MGAGPDAGAAEFHPAEQTKLDISRASDGVVVTFTGVPGAAYRLQAASGMEGNSGTAWVDVEAFEPFPSPTVVTRSFGNTAGVPRFYRLTSP